MYSQAINNKKWIVLCLLSLFIIPLTGCDSDESVPKPTPVKDTTAPTVESFFPAEDLTSNFKVDFEVDMIFSELMNEASLTDEGGVKLLSGVMNFESGKEPKFRKSIIRFEQVPSTSINLVSGAETPVPATRLYLRHVSGRFALDTAYIVMVDDPARDLVEDDPETPEDDRNFVSDSTSLDFTTEKGEWKQARSMPNTAVALVGGNEATQLLDRNQYAPFTVSNKQGDALALWRQESTTPGLNQLWLSRFLVNDRAWRLADIDRLICTDIEQSLCANSERIDTLDGTSILEYHAAINSKGQVAVVWTMSSAPGEFVSVWARIFDGAGWRSATEISAIGVPKTGHADTPQIVIDSEGNVVAVWREHNGAESRIKSNIFKVDANGSIINGSWYALPFFVDANVASSVQTPRLVIGDTGLIMAVWAQNDNQFFRIFNSRLHLSTSDDWSVPARIDQIDPAITEPVAGNSSFPDIAIDPNGDAIAIWLKHDGQRNNVWVNRFVSNWGTTAFRLEGDRQGDAAYPGIQISDDSRALAVWTQRINTINSVQLIGRFFELDRGWLPEAVISENGQIHKPVTRFDREGNAHIIWQEGLTQGRIKTSYYSQLRDLWSSAQEIAANGNHPALTPLFEDGRFLAVWENESDTKYRLNFTRFSE